MNRTVRIALMPEWEDHGLDLPQGVIAKRDGDFGALVFGPNNLGIRISTFDRKALPELLRRLGVMNNSTGRAPARPVAGSSGLSA